MVDLVAADVTVTVEKRQRAGRDRRNRCKIAFGDGAKTYPSGGVPLPAFGSFGLGKVLDYLVLIDADDATGLMWKYDKDNNKLRAYRQNIRTGSTAVGAAESGALAEDVNAAESVARIPNVAIDTDVDIGRLAEETATTATIPATTIYAEAVGF